MIFFLKLNIWKPLSFFFPHERVIAMFISAKPFETTKSLGDFRLPLVQSTLDSAVSRQVEELLKKAAKIEIEIGCGKGKFLAERAIRHPETCFIGIDRVMKWMKKKIRQVEREALQNIIFIKADAREVLRQCIQAKTVAAFHVYFPDPWPKRRHQKRRLVNSSLIKLLHDRLVTGGALFLATDHLEYFDFIKKEIVASSLSWIVHESKNKRMKDDGLMKTHYETKYQTAGKDLYYLELIKP